MARVVVDVMLKPEILDPQGRAVMGALGRFGLTGISSVRQGKRFEIEVDGEITEDLADQLNELAGSLLSNPVIEDYEIYEESDEPFDEDGAEGGACGCGECDCDEPEQGSASAESTAQAGGQS